MKKVIGISNLILMLALFAMDVVYIVIGGITIKSITSTIFVLIGFINLVYAIKQKVNLKYPIMQFVGLVFAMLGDVILEVHFITGAVIFAIGHVMFFISYGMLEKFSYKDLIYGGVIFVPSLLFMVLAPFFEYGGVGMEIVCVIYALIISLMVGKAIANVAKNRSLLNIIIMIGSIMFFLSDLMLLLNVFGGLPVVGIICLALYYPAEFLLAFAIFIYAEKNADERKQTKNLENESEIK